jgi:hypothetical protein
MFLDISNDHGKTRVTEVKGGSLADVFSAMAALPLR